MRSPDRHAGILDLKSRCTADDLRASCRRFVQTFLARAHGRLNAGVRRGKRGADKQMEERQRHEEAVRPHRAFPRWPAAVALLIVGALYAVISGALTFGPRAFLLERVMNLGENHIGMRIPRSARFPRDFRFPHS